MQTLLARRLQFLPVFIILIAFNFSCKNKYEKAALGDYVIYDYKRLDTSFDLFSLDSPKLTLKGNNTFLLSVDGKSLKGKWSADDDGDRTLIRFDMDSVTSDGVISGDSLNIIEIWNPNDFGFPLLRSLLFKKIY